LFLLGSGAAYGDELWLGSGAKVTGVRVIGIRGSDVQFRHRGEVRVKALGDVHAIILDGMDDLKAAERSMKDEQFDQAARLFERLRDKVSRDWQREWIDFRWAVALSRTDRIEAAVRQYLTVIERFPRESREAIPQPKRDIPSAETARLIPMIAKAIEGTSSASVKEDLSSLRMAILEHTTNLSEVAALLEKNSEGREMTGDVASLLRSGDDAGPTLAACRLAIQNKEWNTAKTKVLEVIQSAEGDDLAQAYFLNGLVTLNGTDEEKGWVRAGWWFMRVVAHSPESRWAAQALYQTALIEKKCGRGPKALSLLQECKKMSSLSVELTQAVDAAIEELSTSG
jgi:hypothetical protein